MSNKKYSQKYSGLEVIALIANSKGRTRKSFPYMQVAQGVQYALGRVWGGLALKIRGLKPHEARQLVFQLARTLDSTTAHDTYQFLRVMDEKALENFLQGK